MKDYVYSPSENSFFPLSLRDVYETAGTWPQDGIEVENSVFEEFSVYPPEGKVRVAGENGPEWGDIPPPSKEELVMQATVKKGFLRAEADSAIAPLQDAADEDMATPDETARLSKWKKYRVLLSRVDTNMAPNIEWPVKPE